jgi:hypothetical protein
LPLSFPQACDYSGAMATAGLGAPAVASSRTGDAAPHRWGTNETVAAAWLCAIPCTVVVALAALVLGPPLGRLLAADPAKYTFFPEFARAVHPESTEQARFLIALSLPVLMTLAIAASPRWLPRPLPRWSALAIVGVQLALVALVVACYVAQTRFVYGEIYTAGAGELPFKARFFTPATLVVAALGVAATLLVLRVVQLRQAAAELMRDSRTRRTGALLAAVAATAIWMLHAVHTDDSLTSAALDVRFHLSFTMDETFAVLNGMSPLVDFSAQYGSLWPYLTALAMLAFGKTALTFTLAMCTLTTLALLALFGVLRRVTHSATAALLLYLPVLATSLFLREGPLENRSTVGTYYGTFPLRYAIPYFLAFLTARHLDRRGGMRGAWPLFVVGGLGILNNGDYGIAAFGATIAALAWSAEDRSRAALRQLAAAAGGGLAIAVALVSILTLVRAGTLPHVERLVDYARLFATSGFGMKPLSGVLGMHLAIYLTYVAAIAVATVQAVRRAPDRLLTGMLAWTGIFGLGSASYFMGRSHPDTLKATFSVWALALALLTVVVVRELAANPRRRPTIAALAVLFGMGVAACSLAQTPTPWSQIERLEGPFVPNGELISERPLVPSTDPRTRRFVASVADGPRRFVMKRGAPVAILMRTGHRIADAYGIHNVSPYTGIESSGTVQRTEAILDALDEAGGNTVILPNPVDRGMFEVLERRGFRLVTHHGLDRYDPSVPHGDAVILPWPYDFVLKWVDTRHLHLRAPR